MHRNAHGGVGSNANDSFRSRTFLMLHILHHLHLPKCRMFYVVQLFQLLNSTLMGFHSHFRFHKEYFSRFGRLQQSNWNLMMNSIHSVRSLRSDLCRDTHAIHSFSCRWVSSGEILFVWNYRCRCGKVWKQIMYISFHETQYNGNCNTILAIRHHGSWQKKEFPVDKIVCSSGDSIWSRL